MTSSQRDNIEVSLDVRIRSLLVEKDREQDTSFCLRLLVFLFRKMQVKYLITAKHVTASPGN